MYKLFQADKIKYYYITIRLKLHGLVCLTSALGFFCREKVPQIARISVWDFSLAKMLP